MSTEEFGCPGKVQAVSMACLCADVSARLALLVFLLKPTTSCASIRRQRTGEATEAPPPPPEPDGVGAAAEVRGLCGFG